MFPSIASTSATKLIVVVFNAIVPTTTIVPCDEEDDIDFVFQFEIMLGSQEASNVDLDATWETLLLKLVANQSLWSPCHQSSIYWVIFVVNNGATMNNCNPQMM
jgi:hypothetical protein